MTTTIEMTEAMSAADLRAACKILKVAVGPRADIGLMVSMHARNGDESVYLSVRPTGEYAQGAPYFTFTAATWPKAFSAAYDWASTYDVVRRNATTRKMALAVIELTDEHVTCTEALLRGKGFTAAEIVEFHEVACVRAGEMCSGAPFRVVFS
jgi:hypothetical protein